MDKMHPFFLFVNKFVDLSRAEFDAYIAPFVEVRYFRKREMIVNDGEVENYLNFVVTGLVRKYYQSSDEDFITQLATEGHVINIQESFYTRTPSHFCLQALEPVTLLSLHWDNMENLLNAHPKMERLGRLVVTYVMVLKDRWQMNLTRMSPRDRFIDFVSKNPELLQRVPQKYLASYLNIQPETFSRFKHLLKERKPEAPMSS